MMMFSPQKSGERFDFLTVGMIISVPWNHLQVYPDLHTPFSLSSHQKAPESSHSPRFSLYFRSLIVVMSAQNRIIVRTNSVIRNRKLQTNQ